MASYDVYGKTWEGYEGKTVIVDGLKCRLRVQVYQARYPYPGKQIEVSAVPVSKTSKRYREVKAYLGDDWSTDVLSSDITVQSAILEQLGEQA
jgi:hypothetical protein